MQNVEYSKKVQWEIRSRTDLESSPKVLEIQKLESDFKFEARKPSWDSSGNENRKKQL